MVGVVVSHKNAKTAIVEVRQFKIHPKYHKRYTVSKRYPVHDEENVSGIGDRVEIAPCRPMSRTKRFAIVRKLS